MLTRFLRKIIYAVTLLRIGEFKVFIDQLRRQVYYKHLQIGQVKNLDNLEKNPIECPIKYHLRAASEDDMNEVFQKVKAESTGSAYIPLIRKRLYESGCGKWFVARTTDTDELCYFQCVISSEDNQKLDKVSRNRFPRLKEDEILFEYAYTFEKYRGNRLAGSVLFDLMEIYRNKDFKRVLIYIDKTSESQLKWNEARGFMTFEEVSVIRTMFFSKRNSRPF